MATIPTSRQSIPTVYVGAQGFNAINGPEIQSSQRVQSLLAAERKQLVQQEETEAVEAVARRAAAQQLQSEGLVQTPQDLATRYQQVFEDKAETLYANQVIGEAAKVREDLAAENEFDAAGFAQGWNAYMHGQIEGLRESEVAPDIIQQTWLVLNEAGLTRQSQIESATAARSQRMAGFEYRSSMLNFRDTAGSHLYTKPDEEYLYNAMEVWENRVQDGVLTGYLTPLQGASMIRDGRQGMINNFVTGAFDGALTHGQVGRARGIVRSLRAGRWFTSMKQGRKLADSLASRVEARMSSVVSARRDIAGEALDRVQRLRDVAENGGPVSLDSETAQTAIHYIEAYGTPEQKQDLAQTMTGIKVYTALDGASGGLTPEQMSGQLGAVRQMYLNGQVSETVYDYASSYVQDWQEDVATARQTGNIKALAPTSWGAPPEVRLQDAKRAVQTAGAPKSQITLFSDDEVGAVSDRYQGAVDAEARVDAVDELYAQVPAGFEQQVSRRVADTPVGPAFAAMSQNLESGRFLVSTAAQGAALPSDIRSRIDIGDVQVADSKIMETATIMAQGNATLRNSIYSFLLDSVRGIAANNLDEDPRAAVQEAFKTLASRTAVYRQNTITLANGAPVRAQNLAASPELAQDTADAANYVLMESPEFRAIRAHDTALSQVYPVTLPDGSLAFTATTNPGALIPNPQTDDPMVVPADKIPMLAENWRKSVEADFGWDDVFTGTAEVLSGGTYGQDNILAEAIGAMDSDAGLLKEAQVTVAVRAVPDSNPKLMTAISQAVGSLAPETLEWRNADTGLEIPRMAEVSQTADYRRALGAALSPSGGGTALPTGNTPMPVESRSGTFVASSLILRDAIEERGSLDEALLAYWLGDDVLDAVQADAGAEWEAEIPEDAWAFVEEVKSIYE